MRRHLIGAGAAGVLLLALPGCGSDAANGDVTQAAGGPGAAAGSAGAASGARASGAGTASTTDRASSAPVDYNPQPYEALKDGGTFTSGGSFSGDDTQGLPWNVNGTLTGSRIWNWYNPVAITFSPGGDVQINKDYYTEATATTVNGKFTVTLTINPKATYNNGKPIDWRSIEQTWKVNNGSNPDYQIGSTTGWREITGVAKGKNDRQAVVTFKQPYSAWPALFSTFINPAAATVENFNNAYSNKLQPDWGAGPFTVGSYDPNSKQIVFVRNDKWWGRPAKLDKRIYLDLDDSQASINAFRNGQVDYVGTGSAETLKQITGVPGTQIRRGASPFEYSLFLNGKSELLKDAAVRKAVLQAVNREEIAKIQFQGLDYTEPLPGSALYYSFQPYYQDNVAKVLSFSTEAAGQTLQAAGWTPGAGGIREKNGTPLKLTYVLYSTEPLDKATAASLVASLKQAGIQLDLKTIDSAQWSSTINGGKFDLIVSGNRSLDPYGSFGLNDFYGSKSENNITGVGSPELDKQIAAVNTIGDPEKQAAQANLVEQKALSLYGVLPLYSGPSIYGVKNGLANVGASILAAPLPETIGWEK